MPVPENETDGVLDALLENVTLPDALPFTVGANTTEYVVLCPAASVLGKVRPLMEYAAPVTVADEIVTLPPDAVSVPDNVAVVPMATFPNASEPGLAFSCSTATPVPESATAVGLFVAVLRTEICPEALPADPGANFAV